jgi:hypothetical protein
MTFDREFRTMIVASREEDVNMHCLQDDAWSSAELWELTWTTITEQLYCTGYS